MKSLALFLAALACSPADTPPSSNYRPPVQQASQRGINEKITCRITRISDGDTVHCGAAGRIRLLMIDAPELSQGRYGNEAKEKLAEILPVGTEVTVQTDVRPRDTYKRILGYVYLPDGRMANEEMARTGYVTALVYPPNVKYVERIRAAVSEARRAKRGLWATRFFDCSPRDYRANRCG
ncbi:MAG TPA: thermonuclease family protein [Gemmatimonadaceae bacterium]